MGFDDGVVGGVEGLKQIVDLSYRYQSSHHRKQRLVSAHLESDLQTM